MGQGDRIRTFIHGFDDKLGGGIPEGHVVLLAGEPGTMKSTIAFNMIYQNALRDGRPGTYVSLEQGRENLTRHLDQMSLSPRDVESKVSIVDLGMIRSNLDDMADRTWLEIFKMYALNLKPSTTISSSSIRSRSSKSCRGSKTPGKTSFSCSSGSAI